MMLMMMILPTVAQFQYSPLPYTPPMSGVGRHSTKRANSRSSRVCVRAQTEHQTEVYSMLTNQRRDWMWHCLKRNYSTMMILTPTRTVLLKLSCTILVPLNKDTVMCCLTLRDWTARHCSHEMLRARPLSGKVRFYSNRTRSNCAHLMQL